MDYGGGSDVHENKKEESLVLSEMSSKLILIELIRRCDGILWSFGEAIQQLKFFEKKQTRRVPWKCDLEIGGNFTIKIKAYIHVSETNHTKNNFKLVLPSISFFSVATRNATENGNGSVETRMQMEVSPE